MIQHHPPDPPGDYYQEEEPPPPPPPPLAAAGGEEGPDLERLAARAGAALELVHDPAVALYKNVRPAALTSPAARAELRRRLRALLKHCWELLGAGYGIAHGMEFFSVHRPGDPRNCLALTPDAEQARLLAQWWWSGPGGVEVSCVSAVDALPEAWVALPLALQWARPPWLAVT